MADIRELKDRAAKQFSKGRFDKAAADYEELCRLEPRDTQLRVRLGDSYVKQGQKESAIAAYRVAAETYAKDGFLPRAIAVCKLILEVDPQHVATQQILAQLYAKKTGRPLDAPANTARPQRAAAPRPATSAELRPSVSALAAEEIELDTSDRKFTAGVRADAANHAEAGDPSGLELDTTRASGARWQKGGLEFGRELSVPAAAPAAQAEAQPERRATTRRPMVELEPPADSPAQPAAAPRQPAIILPPPGESELAGASPAVASAPPVPAAAIVPPAAATPVQAATVSAPPPASRPTAPPPAAVSAPIARPSAPAATVVAPPSAPPSTAPAAAAPATRPSAPPAAAAVGVAATSPAPVPTVIVAPTMPPATPPASTTPALELEDEDVLFGQAPVPGTASAPAGFSLDEVDLGEPELVVATSPAPPAAAESRAPAAPAAGAGSWFAPPDDEAPREPGSLADLDIAAVDEDLEIEILTVTTDLPVDAERLPEIPLFSDLSREAFVELASQCELRRPGPGEVLVKEGSIGTSFFVVCGGSFKVCKGGGANEMVLAKLTDGAFFGEMALLSGAPRTASVVAEEDAECLEISATLLADLQRRYPHVGQVLKKFMRQRLLANVMATSTLFRPFAREDRKALIEKFKARDVAAGEAVIAEGQLSDGLYVVMAGQFDVSKLKDGAPVSLAQLHEGDVFGEISLLTKSAATATVSALKRGTVLRLPRAAFDELISTHPQILALVSELSDERLQIQEAIAAGAVQAGEDGLMLV